MPCFSERLYRKNLLFVNYSPKISASEISSRGSKADLNERVENERTPQNEIFQKRLVTVVLGPIAVDLFNLNV